MVYPSAASVTARYPSHQRCSPLPPRRSPRFYCFHKNAAPEPAARRPSLTAGRHPAILSAMSTPAPEHQPISPIATQAAGRLASAATKSTKLKRLLWSIVEATLFRYSFHTWSNWRAMLLRLFGAKIGRNCIIRRTSKVYYPWMLEMGDLVIIGDNANLYCLGKVTLGNRCMVSQEAYLCAGTHDYTRLDLPLVTKPITIGEDAWVCAKAFIGPGVTVGTGAVVGACAVVDRDVPAWTIVAGNPARIISERHLES